MKVEGLSGAGTRGQYLLDISIPDTVLPEIVSVSGLPGEGATTARALERLEVRFSEDLNASSVNASGSWELLEAGADEAFGTGDDTSYVLTASPSYGSGTSVELLINGGPLPEGSYRFRALSGGLTDRGGNALDGDGDGTGGDDYVRTFGISCPAGVVLEGYPNDSWATATELALAEDPSGSGYWTVRGLGGLWPAGDRDYWSFEAAAGDVLSVAVDTPESNLCMYVSLRDGTDSQLTSEDRGTGPDQDALISQYRVPGGGRYYLWIRNHDWSGWDRRRGSYEVRVDVVRGGVQLEYDRDHYNHTLGQSTELSLGPVGEGAIGATVAGTVMESNPWADRDYFALGTLSVGNSVELSMRYPSVSELSGQVSLVDSTDVRVTDEDGEPLDAGARCTIETEGLYYVKVEGLSGAGTRGQYLLDVSVADVVPPRITSISPVPLEGGTLEKGIDLFSLTFSEDMNASTVNDPAHWELLGAGPDGALDTADDQPWTLTLTYAYAYGTSARLGIRGGPLPVGSYRFRASSGGLADRATNPLDGDGDGTGGDDYVCHFSIVLPEGVVIETSNNDTAFYATPLQVVEDPPGSRLNTGRGLGTINPLGDIDYYAFHASAGDAVSIAADTPDGGLPLYLALEETGGQTLASANNGTGPHNDAFISSYRIRHSGRHCLWVRNRQSGGWDRATGNYEVRVDIARGIGMEADTNYSNDSVAGANVLDLRGAGAGHALFLDGRDDYVYIGDGPDLSLAYGITFQAWVCPLDPSGDLPVLAKAGSGSDKAYWFGVHQGHFGVLFNDGATDWALQARQSGSICSSVWQHIATVWDGTTWQNYLDGELVDSGTWAGRLTTSTAPLTIGANSAFATTHFAGSLDEVSIWNTARTQDDIQYDMHRGVDPSAPNLAAYWKFDEATGPVARDSSDLAYDGRLGSAADPDESDPAWVTSQVPLRGRLTHRAATVAGNVMESEGGNADEDFFCLGTVETGETIYLTTRLPSVSALSPLIEICDAVGTGIVLAPGSPDAPVALDVTTEGVYYAIVMADRGAGSRGQYLLDAAVWPTGDLESPDLTPTAISMPTSAMSGETILVEWAVANEGTAPSDVDEWYDRVVVSADTRYGNTDDHILATVRHTGILDPDSSYSASAEVALPRGIGGPQYLFVCTDVTRSVNEFISESNNIAHSDDTIAVTLSPYADLVASDVVASTTGVASEPTIISWKVTNQGTGTDAVTDWIDRIVLSANTVYGDPDDRLVAAVPHSGALGVGETYTAIQSLALPADVSGDWYVSVCADGDDAVFEYQFEGNNAAYDGSAISISPAPFADLQVYGLDVIDPPQPLAGQPITVTWSVVNGDTAWAATGTSNWHDSVTLSEDEVLGNGDDVLLAQFPHSGALAVGESYSQIRAVTLPQGIEGDCCVFVATDARSQVFEFTYEDNNSSHRVIPITMPPPPNLEVADIVVPTEAWCGRMFSIEWAVANLGTGAASGFWTDRVYLSEDDVAGADVYLDEFTYSGSLGPGEVYDHVQSVWLPDGIEGNRWLIVHTDYQDRVYEADSEANNIGVSASFEVYFSPYPDLEIGGVNAPHTAWGGHAVTVDWSVLNNGTGSTETVYWYDRLYLSMDTSLDWQDTYLGQFWNLSYLGPGEGYVNAHSFTLPVTAWGPYYVIAVADFHNDVLELNPGGTAEANNTGYNTTPIQVQMPPLPDLQVTNVAGPRSGWSGQPVYVTWTVENRGAGPTFASYWQDTIYLSEDEMLDTGSDTRLGTFGHSGLLDAGESYRRTERVTLPIGISGAYHLFVLTDSGGHVYEHVWEHNNSASDPTPCEVGLTPPPDLEVVSVTPTSLPAYSGQPLTFEWVVGNTGPGDTVAAHWSDAAYLSEDEQLDTGADIRLGTFDHHGVLLPDSSYTESRTITLPNGLSGTYYLLVKADYRNSVYEFEWEGNNVAASVWAFEIELTDPPDLQVTDIAPPTDAWSGQPASVTWTVTNAGVGDTAATFWYDSAYLSEDEALDTRRDTHLGRRSRDSALGPGEEYSASLNFTLPVGASGTYHVFVITDSDGRVYEHTAEAETNNASHAAFEVSQSPPPDFLVTSLTAPEAASSGQSITVEWTVVNAGDGAVPSAQASWNDKLFLSTDATLQIGWDVLLGTFTHNGVLAAGDTYTQTRTLTIPNAVEGSCSLLLFADADESVTELADDNNDADTAIEITLTPWPDLQVAAVDAPETGVSGQRVTVSWTIANAGAGPTAESYWYDSIYLSKEQILDSSDTKVGYRRHNGILAAGGTYTADLEFRIPAGFSGLYYVFLVTDSTSRVYEYLDEGNNTGYDATPMEVAVPPPTDLVVSAITVPATGVVGQAPPSPITWTVTNEGSSSAVGSWQDAVYLSADDEWDIDDPLVAHVPHAGDVAPGASYAASTTSRLPGVVPGDYHVIVRADVRNEVRERQEDNNAESSVSRTALDVEELTLDAVTSGALSQGQSAYYRVQVPAGETLLLTVAGEPATTVYEVYVRHGKMPTRAIFDHSSSHQLLSKQSVTVPKTRAGEYYVLLYGNSALGAAIYEILAETPRFSVRQVTSSRGGNAGKVTVLIEGAKLTPDTEFSLRHIDGDIFAGAVSKYVDQSLVFVTFNLVGADPGLADVRAVKDDSLATLERSFEIVPGAPAHLLTAVVAPGVVRPDRAFAMLLEYANEGVQDMRAPVLSVTSEGQAALGGSPSELTEGMTSVQASAGERYGPHGILRPGAAGTIPLMAKGSQGNLHYELLALLQGSGDIDWESIKEQYRHPSADPTAFEAFWSYVSDQLGHDSDRVLESIAHRQSELEARGFDASLTSVWRNLIFVASFAGAEAVARGDAHSTSRRCTKGPSPSSSNTAALPKGGGDTDYVYGYNVWGQTGIDPSGTIRDGHPLVVIAHGWQNTGGHDGTPPEDWIQEQANAVRQHEAYRDANIVVVDWGEDAQTALSPGGYDAASSSVPVVGLELALFLKNNRDKVKGEDVHIIGHSLGAHVAGVAGRAYRELTGESIGHITGLDPARPNFETLGADGRLDPTDADFVDIIHTTTWLGDPQESGDVDFYAEDLESWWFHHQHGEAHEIYTDTIAGGEYCAEDGTPVGWNVPHDATGSKTFDATPDQDGTCPEDDVPGVTPMDELPPWRPSDDAIQSWEVSVVAPVDPNAKSGPGGGGESPFVRAGDVPSQYTVYFENTPDATAPAQMVTIIDPLDDDLDWRSFRLGEIAFGDTTITVPEGRSFYQTRLGLESGLLLDIDAGINIVTGEAVWNFTTIDSDTGEPPTDPMAGFLPPNDETHCGEGHVTFTIKPNPDSPTGTVITNRASIVFDTEEPLETNEVSNTVDAGASSSAVAELPATTAEPWFSVSWSGTDDEGGSGLAHYDIYVSDNDGPYQLWLGSATDTSDVFDDTLDGHTYRFYSIAQDNVGNREDAPADADAVIVVQASAPRVAATEPAPGALTNSSAPAILVDFNEQMAKATAEDIAYYGLAASGGDGTFADGNETLVSVDSAALNGGSRRVTLTVNGGAALADDVYQLTVTDSITDVAGNSLDGEYIAAQFPPSGDGNPGGSFVCIFRIDATAPVSTVVVPAHGSELRRLDEISGTALDLSSEVVGVEVSVGRLGDGAYWDGSAWAVSESWLETTGTNVWSRAHALPSWESGQAYVVRSRATDEAGNVETPGVGTQFTFCVLSLTVSPMSLLVPEGDSRAFTVGLSCDPEATVAVSVERSAGDSDLDPSLTTLTFTPENWSALQTVVVTAAQDVDTIDGEATIRVSSADCANSPQDVTVTERDDDRDFYVNDDAAENGVAPGDDANDGKSPLTPMRHVQALLDRYPSIGAGSTVHVSAGTYAENVVIVGTHSGLALHGAAAAEAIIDGGASGPCVALERAADVKISNLTLRNGQAPAGGGMYCDSSSATIADCTLRSNAATRGGGFYCSGSTVTMSGCTIAQNTATHTGGGMDASGSSVTMTGCTITGNVAEGVHGGGIHCATSSLDMTNCTVCANSAGEDGGGIFCYDNSSPIVTDSTIGGNSAGYIGGGIVCMSDAHGEIANCTIAGNIASHGGAVGCAENASPKITNCIITGNRASDDGGAIYCLTGSPSIVNSTLASNRAAAGGGIYCKMGSSPTLTNCILWGNLPQEICFSESEGANTLTASYSDVQGGPEGIVTNDNGTVAWGEGNINSDPLFVPGPAGGWESVSYNSATFLATLTDTHASWEPDALARLLLNPNTSQGLELPVVSNTETEIVVLGDTTGIASPGDTYQVRDYRLAGHSPCIDSAWGDQGVLEATVPLTDVEGNPRYDDSNVADTGLGSPAYVDMGAFERQADSAAVTVEDVTATEGDDLEFTVTLDSAVQGGFTVTVTFTDVTATGGSPTLVYPEDYDNTQQTLIFAGNAGETQDFTVWTGNDDVSEADETFTVNLSADSPLVADSDTAIGTITDNDDPPRVTLAVDKATIGEDDETATFTATLSAVSGQDVTVSLGYSGTATLTDDYTRSGTQIVIPAGQTTGTAMVTAVQDTLDEPDETVVVDITGVTHASEAGTQQAQTTITDDDPQPCVTLSVAPGALSEGEGGVATLTATLSAASGQNVTVTLSFSGTTTLNEDYTVSGTQIVVPAGQATGTGTVTLLDDALYEGEEAVIVDIGSVDNGRECSSQQQTIIVTDDDPLPSLSVDDLTADEDAGTMTFTVRLSAASGLDISFDYTTSDGTAEAGKDYTTKTDTLTIPAGAPQGTIDVPLLDDALDEETETFTVDLSNPVNATLGDDEGTGTITDDDPPPTVTLGVDHATIAEDGGVATFTATLSAVSGLDVTVNLAFGGTATPTDDYTRSSTQIVIPAGQTTGTATVTAVQDGVDEEASERVVVDIQSVTNGTESGTQQQMTTITDDDPTPSLSADDPTADEDAGTMTFTVSLSAVSGLDVSVDYTTSDGTATAGKDYTTTTGTLTIPAGAPNGTVGVPLLDDALDEDTETFTIDLSDLVNATVSDGKGTGTITDEDPQPTVTLGVDHQMIDEDGGVATFTATLSAVSGLDVTVDLAFSGTATLTDDYTRSSTQIVIPAGQTTGTATVTAAQDGLDESSETVVVDIQSVTNGTESGSQQQMTTITDDDPPPSLSVDNPSADEDRGTMTFTVSLSAVSGLDVSFDYTTSDGTATAGKDYTTATGTLTIPAGAPNGTVDVPLLDDALDEETETFTLDLSSPVNATLADSEGTGTIQDDDPKPTVTLGVDHATIAEDGGVAAFTATLSAVSGLDVTVNLAFGGTATPTDDYTRSSTQIVIPAGQTTGTATVTAVQDGVDEEASERVVVDIQSVTNGTESGTQQQMTTITDDDPTPSLSADDPTADEDAGTMTFTVSLSAVSGLDVSFEYATTDGTATAGKDYTTTTDTVTIPAGAPNTEIDVPLLNDELDEDTETFTLDLSKPDNATVSDGEGTGSIADDDPAPVVTLGVDHTTIDEAGGVATFTATLSAVSGLDVTVDLAVGGGATPTDDYVLSGTQIVIPAGQTTGTVTVTAVQDALDENDETVVVDIDGATNGTESRTQQQMTTITDDDPKPSLSVDDPTEDEDAGTMTFTVSLSAVSGLDVSFDYTTSDGTATAGKDYTTTTGTLTIPAGAPNGTIGVPLLNDHLDEDAETFTLDLSDLVNATVSDGEGTGSIADDDPAPVVTLGVDHTTIDEAGGVATFTATLSAVSGLDVTVDLAFSGTATFTDDYTRSGTQIVVPVGDATGTVTVTAAQDGLDEISETVVVDIQSVTNGTESGTQQQMTTITDDDPKPSLSVDDPTEDEDKGPMTFTVSLSAVSGLDVSFDYTTSDGTGEAGKDYTTTTGKLTIPAGAPQGTIDVPLLDDALHELTETFTLDLSNPVNATPGDSEGTGSIADDDPKPTVTLGADHTTIEEDGGVATFTVTLSAVSGVEVTVDLAFGGTATLTDDYTRSSTQIVVPVGDATGTVTVTAVQDRLDEDSETVVVGIGGVTHGAEDGTQQKTTSITDDDTAGVTVSPTSGLTTTEVGGTDTFTVVLDSEPTADVTIGLSSSDTTEGTVSLSSLKFTAGNWDTAQSVTVTGVDDDVDDGDIAYTVVTEPAVSADAGYNGLDPDDVAATNEDDDVQSLVVSTQEITVRENGSEAFTVALKYEPTTDVTVTVTKRDGGDADLSLDQKAKTLTFTTENWDAPQSVSVYAADDDDVCNGSADFEVSSSGLVTVEVTATEVEDDEQELVVSPTDLPVPEGGNNPFTVRLKYEPCSNVTITVTKESDGDPDLTLAEDVIVMVFTPSTWNLPQNVTVYAAYDDDVCNGSAVFPVSSPGLPTVEVTATEVEDDVQSLVVEPTELPVPEGDDAEFTVALAYQPCGDVTVTVTKKADGDDDLNLCAKPGPQERVFTTENWGTAQTVLVCADHDDDVCIGRAVFEVKSAGMTTVEVTATEEEDDVQALVVEPTQLPVPEGGDATFDVKLAYQPCENVTVTVTKNPGGDGDLNLCDKLDSIEFVLTTDNWDQPQSVCVRAEEDEDTDDGSAVFEVASGTLSVDVTATEDDDDIILTVETTDGGTTDPSGPVPVDTNDDMPDYPIAAEPDDGFAFDHWTETVPGSIADKEAAATTVTSTQDVTATAHFRSLNYYVNDAIIDCDLWCTDVGDAANSGTSPDAPLDSVQAVLDTYDLEPGDTVYVDAGEYDLSAAILIGAEDSGTDESPVTLQGVGSQGTCGSSLLRVGADDAGVIVQGATGIKIAGIACEGTAKTDAAGIEVLDSTWVTLIQNQLYGHGTAIVLELSGDVLIASNFIYGNGQMGIQVTESIGATDVVHNTFHGNQCDLGVAGACTEQSISVLYNIFWATGKGCECFNVDALSQSAFADSDHNDLFASKKAIVGHWGDKACKKLKDWQKVSGQDAGSISVGPAVRNAKARKLEDRDYHLTKRAKKLIDKLGNDVWFPPPIPGLPVEEDFPDIDGESRPWGPSPKDVKTDYGADEHVPDPAIQAPKKLKFKARVGEYDDRHLEIGTKGGPLTVHSVVSSNPVFEVDPNGEIVFPRVVSWDDPLKVLVRFAPEEKGKHKGTLTIHSNDPKKPKWKVKLLGKAKP